MQLFLCCYIFREKNHCGLPSYVWSIHTLIPNKIKIKNIARLFSGGGREEAILWSLFYFFIPE